MTPKRPYLLRAFYDWIVDNNMTPHIMVDAAAKDVNVPRQHINDGKIVLNISPMAVQDFMMDNEALSFSARFGGVSFYVYCPMYSIEALYAREAPVEGVSFAATEYEDTEAATDGSTKTKPSAPVLTAVSNHTESDTDSQQSEVSNTVSTLKPGNKSEEAPSDSHDSNNTDDDDDTPPTRKRPSLRVIK